MFCVNESLFFQKFYLIFSPKNYTMMLQGFHEKSDFVTWFPERPKKDQEYTYVNDIHI